MKTKVIETIGEEPISIGDCRAHLEQMTYGDSDIDPVDDALILDKLATARQNCETFLGLSLVTKIIEGALDSFPGRCDDPAIELPWGPVREVLSFSYGDASDALALTPDDYVLDDYSAPARLTGTWPTVTAATNTVKIRYLAGYGVDSDGGEQIPPAIRGAILLTLGELFANRENAVDVALHEIPTSAESLLRPLRVRLGMA